jgi:leader peptidase (prepilin peptidase) / N-methyltransferase
VQALLLADFPPWFLRAFALAFGLVWGSFLNVVIYRVPRGMSVVRPASHCPACGAAIPFYRNVPVVSWLVQRGRAACCGVRVSPRYVLVEAAGGVICWAILESLVLTLEGATLVHGLMVFLAHAALALALIAAAFIDLEFMIVPDAITFGGTMLGLFTFALRDIELIDAVIGAVAGFLVVWLPFDVIYRRIRGRPGMGLGDAKLLMLAGAWFGWGGMLFVLGAGAIQGTIVTLIMLLGGRQPEEPEAVRREREEIRAEIEAMDPAAREELERELAADPLGEEAGEGVGQARIAFGPFLILATLELQLIGRERIFSWLLDI